MKKAIKIDVVNKTIYEVEIKKDKDIYYHIGNECNLFCCPVEFVNGDVLYADDEALYRQNIEGCFVMESWKYPIVGNAIILGSDEEGDSIDHKSTIKDISEKIVFGSKEIAKEYVLAMISPDKFSAN
jgi:hypothetical protein